MEVERLKLKTELEMIECVPLRYWAKKNRNQVFIPEKLLKAWGIEVDDV